MYSATLSSNTPHHTAPTFSGTPIIQDSPPTSWLETLHPNEKAVTYNATLIDDERKCELLLQTAQAGEHTGEHIWGDIHTLLFLSPLVGNKSQIIRISLSYPLEYDYEKLIHNVHISNGHSYTPWRYSFYEDIGKQRHFYFLRPEQYKGEIWVGIPSFFKTALKIELAFGPISV